MRSLCICNNNIIPPTILTTSYNEHQLVSGRNQLTTLRTYTVTGRPAWNIANLELVTHSLGESKIVWLANVCVSVVKGNPRISE